MHRFESDSEAIRQASLNTWTNQGATAFVSMFDRLFKMKTLRLRHWTGPKLPNFLRSCIASLSCIAAMFGIWYVLLPVGQQETPINFYDTTLLGEDFNTFFPNYGVHIGGVVFALEEIFLLPIILNLLPDWISLVETRYVIRQIGRVNDLRSGMLWLVFDALATFAIVTVMFMLVGPILDLIILSGPHTGSPTWSRYFSYLSIAYERWIDGILLFVPSQFQPQLQWRTEYGSAWAYGFWGVFFYSTFLTSIWVWIYFVAGSVVHFARRLDRLVQLIDRTCKLDTQALYILGGISMAIFTFFYWSVCTAIILWH